MSFFCCVCEMGMKNTVKHCPSSNSGTNVLISVFILCGGPNDIISLKSKIKYISQEILFILLDIYK